MRCREGGQRGRRGKKGRRRFRTPWREPKLVTVYVIDDGASRPHATGPVRRHDGRRRRGLPDPGRGAAPARSGEGAEIILTGDGAHWIWNRAAALARALGLRPEQIVKVADFYHAVEHLGDRRLVRELVGGQRRQWVRRMRRRLKAGKVTS